MLTILMRTVLLLPAPLATAQMLVPMTIPQYFTGQLAASVAGYLQALGAAARANAEIASDLKASRVRFWATSPKDPAYGEVAERFAFDLVRKDFVLAAARVINSRASMAKLQGGALSGALLSLGNSASGASDLDGGLFRAAKVQFDDWVACFGDVYTKGERDRAQAFIACKEPYLRYQSIRDVNEFLFANPRSPLLDLATPHEEYLGWWLVAKGWRYDEGSIKAAFYRAKGILSKLTPQQATDLVQSVRDISFVNRELTISGEVPALLQ